MGKTESCLSQCVFLDMQGALKMPCVGQSPVTLSDIIGPINKAEKNSLRAKEIGISQYGVQH